MGMDIWRRLLLRLRRDQLDRDLTEELEFHRRLKEQDYRDAGLSDEAAAYRSLRQMGNLTLVREESRNMWSFLTVERLWQDLVYALRMFWKNPGFTAVAVISLALGIGGNAAVFSLVNALLIQPLPYQQPERLVRITQVYPKAGFVTFQQQSRTMDVASVTPGPEFNLTGQGEAIRLFGSTISVNLFSLLGVSMERGRSFERGEDQPGKDDVVILSHALWASKFGSDPQILDRVILLNGMGRRVVGIMPKGFDYPSARVQLWVPSRIDPSIMPDYWGVFTPLVGRLREGATIAQAQNEVPGIVTRIRGMFPFPMKRDWNANAEIIPLQQDIVGDIRGKLLILLSSVGVVLLIACANVASLLLSLTSVRRKEISLRAALGAGRGRILRQLLTESVVLSLIGGGLGLYLGSAAISIFQSVLPRDLPGATSIGMDFRVFGFAALLATFTGIVFGIVPAWSAAKVDLTESIKTGSQRFTGQYSSRFRNWLIGGELALTLVLVVAAGLLIKTLYVISQVNPGFQGDRILTIRVTPNPSMCQERANCIAHYNELQRRARDIGGVSEVAIANTLPMDGRFTISSIPVELEDHPKSVDFPAPMFWGGAVSPGYFQMMHIHLLAGRTFTEADSENAAGVALISASTAKRYWPDENAVGKHIKESSEQQWRTVVGIVADVRQFSLAQAPPDFISGAIYMPYAQSVQGNRQIPTAMNLLVRTPADPLIVGREMRRLAHDQNPNIPVGEVQTMDGIMTASIANHRSTMSLFISFAIAAIALAMAGIYGLVSYSVSQRTYEIGVRMAIGATKRDVVALVLKQSLRVALAGIAIGVVAAFILTRFLASFLYGVAATDPLTFSVVVALLMVATVIASCVPAWRASRVDPISALRVS